MRAHRAALAFGGALLALCSLQALPPPAAQSANVAPRPAAGARERAVLDQYCATCHSGRRPTADLALDALDVNQVGSAAEAWEKVVAKLRGRAMPPAGLP